MFTNKVTLINPSQHERGNWIDYTRRRVTFKITEWRSLRTSKCMNSWHLNPISHKNKRFIQSMLQCNFWCTGLKRLLHQIEANFRCTWIEPDKQQPNCPRLIGKGQSRGGVPDPLDDTCQLLAFRYLIATSWATSITRYWVQGKQSQELILQKTSPNGDCCQRRGLWGGKCHHRHVNGISG